MQELVFIIAVQLFMYGFKNIAPQAIIVADFLGLERKYLRKVIILSLVLGKLNTSLDMFFSMLLYIFREVSTDNLFAQCQYLAFILLHITLTVICDNIGFCMSLFISFG